MNENINLVEILRDCPSGTKLYSPIFGEVVFKYIIEDLMFPILVDYSDVDGNTRKTCFTKDGKFLYSANGECVLFPSKEQRDWSKFTAPWYKKESEHKFHEGDWVVYNNDICQIVKREEGCNKLVTVFGIEKELVNERNLSTARLWTVQDTKDGDVICYRDEISLYKNEIKNYDKQDTTFGGFVYYCCYDGKNFITNSFYLLTEQEEIDIYPATKEQREILMKAMNNAGYEFDIEKKELKKFVHNKFDPKTLEPFDKILVRRTNENHDVWFPDFVSNPPDDTSNKTLCMCIMEDIAMVIPYNDDTKHLVGTSDEAPEYYRYWE